MQLRCLMIVFGGLSNRWKTVNKPIFNVFTRNSLTEVIDTWLWSCRASARGLWMPKTRMSIKISGCDILVSLIKSRSLGKQFIPFLTHSYSGVSNLWSAGQNQPAWGSNPAHGVTLQTVKITEKTFTAIFTTPLYLLCITCTWCFLCITWKIYIYIYIYKAGG